MWNSVRPTWACVGLLILAGCTQNGQTNNDPPLPMAGSVQQAQHTEGAGETYDVKFETSKGDFVIEVHRNWAPNGADRFEELVNAGFYDECRFFRVIDGFMAQVGINGDPDVHARWDSRRIPDDPVLESNRRGYVSFATSGPNSRTTQFFINFINKQSLDGMGFAPFGKVVEGMDVVDSLYKGYGGGPDEKGGRGPTQGRIQTEGNAYLKRDFPKLDYIIRAMIVRGAE